MRKHDLEAFTCCAEQPTGSVMTRVGGFTLLCFWGLMHGHSEAFTVPLGLGHRGRKRMRTGSNYAASTRRRSLRMDDEIARQGIKEELTTRDEYLATRFTKLSASGHDLTPFTQSEVREAASHLSSAEAAALFEGASDEESLIHASLAWRDHREKGLYACAVGGLPLFTSGWKLDPRPGDEYPSFATPCDDEHLLEEHSVEDGVTFVSCARSRVRVGTVTDDTESPSGRRYSITGAALEFHPLGKALPVRCQPENYWGSEGQYRAWVLE